MLSYRLVAAAGEKKRNKTLKKQENERNGFMGQNALQN